MSKSGHVLVSVSLGAIIAAALAANLAPSPWSQVLFGVALAAALHIVVDAGSPMGVPLLNPFRPVRLCALYRTGEPSELLVIVPAIAAAAHAIVTHPAAIQLIRRFI